MARLHSIDCLRGVAALSVCTLHALTAAPIPPPLAKSFVAALQTLFTHAAELAVILFFVISGFCIHLGAARERARSGRMPFRFGQFWRRRMWRLYPTYFVVLCFSIGLVAVLYRTHPTASVVAAYPEPKSHWIAADFVAHALMLHGLIPRFDHLGGNSPLWTIAREEYLYLLYPAVLFFRRRTSAVITAVLIVLAQPATDLVRAALHLDLIWLQAFASSTLNYWLLWYLGTVSADAAAGVVRMPRALRTLWLVPVWIAISAVVPRLQLQAWGFASFTLVNFCVAREAAGAWNDRGVVRAVTSIGLMSYSLYLIHSPVQLILLAASSRVLVPQTLPLYLGRAAFLFAGSFLAALVLFRVVERRFLDRRTSVAQPARSELPLGARVA